MKAIRTATTLLGLLMAMMVLVGAAEAPASLEGNAVSAAGADDGMTVDLALPEQVAKGGLPIDPPPPPPPPEPGLCGGEAGAPCEGNNYANDNFLDSVLMGGPMVGIRWVPTSTVTISRLEVFTGEVSAPNAVAIWSDDGGSPSRPLAPLGFSNPFTTTLPNAWQGADLTTPVAVSAGSTYWVVWDPSGGEQSSVSGDPGDIQQTYWGSYSGDVTGGASWFGPFSFPDRRWKFKAFCGALPCDGNNHEDDNYRDNVSMGGPVVGIEWIPAASATITRLEVFTGEIVAPNAVAIWSDDGGSPSQPLAPLGYSSPFNTVLPNSWQGANLNSPVAVTAGTKYWVVWDPSGGEQAAVSSNAVGVQQNYWGSYSGDVTGGTSWFGPFSFPEDLWKFRMFCGDSPCAGNNYANNDFVDNTSMGGPMVGIEWTPGSTATINRLEVFTGEVSAPNAVAIWSDDGGSPSRPLAPLGFSNPFTTTLPNSWQGANLTTPVTVTGGTKYWVVWDPAGGEQASLSADPGDIQQSYWGSFSGNVTGGASWFGPFSSKDHRWKFRMFCGGAPCAGNNYANDDHVDATLMGGPVVGIEWTPAASSVIKRLEVYTGEVAGPNAVAIWSDDGGSPSQPLAPLGYSNPFTTSLANGWQGADLVSPVSVTGGTKYWVVWDPSGGEQASISSDPGDIQQSYWGSFTGSVTGGTSWFGPFTSGDHRWKFRMFCGCEEPGCAHDVCTAGEALDPSCGPCVEKVCEYYPPCCDNAWSLKCVEIAQKLCGIDCPKKEIGPVDAIGAVEAIQAAPIEEAPLFIKGTPKEPVVSPVNEFGPETPLVIFTEKKNKPKPVVEQASFLGEVQAIRKSNYSK